MVRTRTAKNPAKHRQKKQSPPPKSTSARGAVTADTPDSSADSPTTAAAAPPTDSSRRSRGSRAHGVSARAAARHIRGLADRCDDLELRSQLRQLARQVDGTVSRRRAAACEALIGSCLDRVDDFAKADRSVADCDSPTDEPRARASRQMTDAWLVREAATWAVARLVRVRKGGGDTGGILGRLSTIARQATEDLAARNTEPAQFLLVLARLFADIEACRLLERDAQAALVEEIGRLVSHSGAVGLSGSDAIIERVVRWTAVRQAAFDTGGPMWPDAVADADAEIPRATDTAWHAAAGFAVRLLGGQGRILSAAGRRPAGQSAPLVAAIRSKGRPGVGKGVRRTARVLLGDTAPRSTGLLPRNVHDASAAMAVMRSDWTGDGLRVLVDYRSAAPRIEVAVGDRLLIDGPWQWAVTVDGRPCEAEGHWTVSCWESDRKATFLELSAPLGGGMQIERQVVLLPRDRIVMLADAVTLTAEASGREGGSTNGSLGGVATNGHASTGAIEYRSVVPLAAALETDAAEESREICIYDSTMRGLALPLGLSEWRGVGRGGFESTPAGLALTQVGRHRLYAPVWIDCVAGRIGGPLTWRQLTVADTRLILPPYQAAGFRVQSGSEQWLVYKTLDAPRNRTLLGCNVSCDFLVGRVKPSGEVARTLEIQ
jgi:hypothetical protein